MSNRKNNKNNDGGGDALAKIFIGVGGVVVGHLSRTNEVSTLTGERDQANSDRTSLVERVQGQDQEIIDLTATNSSLEQENANLEAGKARSDRKVLDLEEGGARMRRDLVSKGERITKLVNEVGHQDAKARKFFSENVDLRREIEALRRENENLKKAQQQPPAAPPTT